MTPERVNLWLPGEYRYPFSFGFQPNLRLYLHEDSAPRPVFLVVPGGGYNHVASPEGEIIALRFFEEGFNAFVLTYTINAYGLAPAGSQPLQDLSRAVRLIRSNSDAWHLQPDKLVVCGFSAGSHLAGALAVHWADLNDARWPGLSNRPDAVLLSYPVITAGEFAHRGSFESLLGDQAADPAVLDYWSIEKHVNPETPPCFLWHSAGDASVPVENSLLMARACQAAQVPYALHIFSTGYHGMSLATETWARGEAGGEYCNEQREILYRLAEKGEGGFTERQRLRISREFRGMQLFRRECGKTQRPNAEISRWPVLAMDWLRAILP